MAIGVYFRTTYERLLIKFKEKRFKTVCCREEFVGDFFANPEWSNVNCKDIFLGVIKFINEKLQISSFHIDNTHYMSIYEDKKIFEIYSDGIHIIIQNYNSYDHCTIWAGYTDGRSDPPLSDIDTTTVIIAFLSYVIEACYISYVNGKEKYNL